MQIFADIKKVFSTPEWVVKNWQIYKNCTLKLNLLKFETSLFDRQRIDLNQIAHYVIEHFKKNAEKL